MVETTEANEGINDGARGCGLKQGLFRQLKTTWLANPNRISLPLTAGDLQLKQDKVAVEKSQRREQRPGMGFLGPPWTPYKDHKDHGDETNLPSKADTSHLGMKGSRQQRLQRGCRIHNAALVLAFENVHRGTDAPRKETRADRKRRGWRNKEEGGMLKS